MEELSAHESEEWKEVEDAEEDESNILEMEDEDVVLCWISSQSAEQYEARKSVYCGGYTSGQSEDCRSNYRGLYRFSEVRTDHVAQTSLGPVNYKPAGGKHESLVTSPLDASMWRLRYENSFLIGMGPCLSLKRSWVLVMDPLHV